jgi:DNA-binding transcriptional LysR family regulator
VELVHLECFVTLAEELHFGRTGTRLHMGGPAVTKRISELERQLGVQLFARTSRQVSLTPAGEALIGPAQRALAEIGAFRAIAGDAAAGMVGAARAAYSPGTGEMITVLTRELKRRTPSVTVHPAQMVSVRVASAVRSGAVAVGIARIPPGPDLHSLVLADSPLTTAALPVSHPLVGRDQLSPEDLAGERVLGPSRSLGGGVNRFTPARLREVDITSEGELFDLVSGGFGILLCSEGTVRRNPRQDVVLRPLVGFDISEKVLLIWRPDDASPVLEEIRSVASDLRPQFHRVALGLPRLGSSG